MKYNSIHTIIIDPDKAPEATGFVASGVGLSVLSELGTVNKKHYTKRVTYRN